MRSYFTAFAFGALALPALVHAQSAPPVAPSAIPAPAAAVTSDAKRSGRSEISPEARARFEAFRVACSVDLKTHCGEVDRSTDAGRAAVRQCIETQQAKFTETCRTAIADRNTARDARKSSAAQPATTEKSKL